MYIGPITSIYDHFEGCGVSVQRDLNPADFIVDLCHTREGEGGGSGDDLDETSLQTPAAYTSPAELVAAYGASPLCSQMEESCSPSSTSATVQGDRGDGRFANGFVTQVIVLLRRHYIIDSRNGAFVFAMCFNGFVLLIQGTTYFLVEDPPEGAAPMLYNEHFEAERCLVAADQAPPGFNEAITDCSTATLGLLAVNFARKALIYQIVNAVYINENLFIPLVFREKSIFHREHSARAYSLQAWHAAWLIKMAFLSMTKLLFYPPFYYFLAKLKLQPTSYFIAAFLTGGMGFAGSATALCCTSLMPSYPAALSLMTLVYIVHQNVCGFFLPLYLVPDWCIWLSWSSVFTYGYNSMLLTQVEGDIQGPMIISSLLTKDHVRSLKYKV